MARAKAIPQTKGKRGWFFRLLRIGLVLAVAGLIALFVAVGIAWSSLPEVSQLRTRDSLGQVIRVRANDGSIIVSLGPIYGEWVSYPQIPQVMVDAMVAVEDKRFRSHLGVDPLGLARAAQIRIQKGRWTQGGSTITQQLARNIFLTNTKTFARKGREMLLALAMERKYSKNEILELYLNRVYFGGGAYGIDAASRRFFDHPATKLNLSESAIIAGLVKAPSNYSPTADAKAAMGRAGVVLDIMASQGKISAAEAKSAQPNQVKLAVEPKQNSVRYFTDWVLPQLDGLIEETAQPIDVWTTLDLKMQNAADSAIRAHTPGTMQGALVSLDRGGAVRAMVGGKDYVSSIYNRATQSVRQPGSSFKLFVYLAALEAGKRPESKMIDGPVNIGGWQPRNSSGNYSGEVTLRTAFTYSLNTIAAKIGAEVGTGAIASMARRLGITTPVNTSPSMVLGTSETRVIDMTRAFAVVSEKGKAVNPYGISKVTSLNGKILYEHKTLPGSQLIEPWVASAMTDLLQTAVATGTGKNAQIGRPVAGKTGTTQSNKDGWFIGFSSGLTTGVWMGHDSPKGYRDLQGGKAPAAAFASFMRSATASRPVEQFDTTVKMPEWQLETEEEAYFGEPDTAPPSAGSMVDADGNPLGGGAAKPDPALEDKGGDPPPFDQQFIDDAIKPDDQVPLPNQ
jgi:penicillin-binding protein 1A